MRNENRIRKILPVDLMIEGRRCLVVGGGFIAARKVGHLLKAGAKVTVVSAAVSPELRRRCEAGKIEHRRRDFRDSDVKGCFLVMAATDNGTVNGRVLRLCRRAGILCASADARWMDADFLTPATLRRPRLTLTISTGGESCRRSRRVKDYLARHLDRLDRADLVIWPVNRQPAAALGALLGQVWGIHEFIILDTPSRFEVLAVASRDASVNKLVIGLAGRPCETRRVKRGKAALRHTADLVKDPEAKSLGKALQRSITSNWAGVMMQDWIKAALSLGGAAAAKSREYQLEYDRILRGL